MPTISIVVPVYNVEKYLDRCMSSLINQTYYHIEIILVDDGSLDNSSKMCDVYVESDLRIKCIHKSNGGLSDARNVGIRTAKGEYILFVDSDDFLELDACERFIGFIKDRNLDVVVGNAKKVEENQIAIMQHWFVTFDEVVTGEQYLETELKWGTMYMAAWLNLYNRDFLLSNALVFKVGLLHEDEQFTPRVFLKAKKVVGTDITFYNYVIREGSITTSVNKLRNAEHILQTCKELEEIYNKVKKDELRKLLNDNLVDKFLNTFQISGLYKKEYSYLVNKKFLKGKALTKRNKLRVLLFILSKTLYYYVNRISKMIK